MSKTVPDCPFVKKFPSSLTRDDEFYLWHAYNLAIDAWRAGEVPVGAVIESEGQIIAAAHNQVETLRDPTAHAELLAITQAATAVGDWRLNGCTIYVTKEPCPMCAGAIIMARIPRVVFAVGDENLGCLGGALALHKVPSFQSHPLVTTGLLHQECYELLRAFFQLKRELADRPAEGQPPRAWN